MSSMEDVVADNINFTLANVNVLPDDLYFKYKDRNFRCSIHDDFDRLAICDGDFDRWANSRGVEVSPCPITRHELETALEFLLNTHTNGNSETKLFVSED